jgi:hypothetical protein
MAVGAAIGGAAVYLLTGRKEQEKAATAVRPPPVTTVMTKETHPVAMISPQKEGPPEPLVKVGEALPSVMLNQLVDGKITKATLHEVFQGKKGVLVSVPGAFTPG